MFKNSRILVLCVALLGSLTSICTARAEDQDYKYSVLSCVRSSLESTKTLDVPAILATADFLDRVFEDDLVAHAPGYSEDQYRKLGTLMTECQTSLQQILKDSQPTEGLLKAISLEIEKHQKAKTSIRGLRLIQGYLDGTHLCGPARGWDVVASFLLGPNLNYEKRSCISMLGDLYTTRSAMVGLTFGFIAGVRSNIASTFWNDKVSYLLKETYPFILNGISETFGLRSRMAHDQAILGVASLSNGADMHRKIVETRRDGETSNITEISPAVGLGAEKAAVSGGPFIKYHQIFHKDKSEKIIRTLEYYTGARK